MFYVQSKYPTETGWTFYAEHNWAGAEAHSDEPLPDFDFGDTFETARDAFAQHLETDCNSHNHAATVRGWSSADNVLVTKGMGGDSIGSLGEVHYRIVQAEPAPFDKTDYRHPEHPDHDKLYGRQRGYEVSFSLTHFDEDHTAEDAPDCMQIGAWASYRDKWASVVDVDSRANGDETYYASRSTDSVTEMHHLVDALFDSVGAGQPVGWPYYTDEELALPEGTVVTDHKPNGTLTFAEIDGVMQVTTQHGQHPTPPRPVRRTEAHAMLDQFVAFAAAQTE